MNWVTGRIKEMSSWSGASLIALGLLIVLGGPFVKIAAYAAIVWGILSVIALLRIPCPKGFDIPVLFTLDRIDTGNSLKGMRENNLLGPSLGRINAGS